jgi:photosystem II stability/assembly factor-like uncharacterized protein
MSMAVAGFVDPLDAPAQMSDLAPSTPLLAITNAGNRLVVAGPRGHILFSDDLGNNWTQAQVPSSVALTDLWFATPELGWAVGHSGLVLQSRDGGATWERLEDGRQTANEVLGYYQQRAAAGDESAARLVEELAINWKNGPEQPWLDVWFENEQHGFIVGPFSLILETQDGGSSWTPWMHRIDNAAVLHLNGVEQIDGALYLPSERGLVFRKGASEDQFLPLQTPYTGSFFGVCGGDGLVLAYGLRGTVYASRDAGDSWAEVKTAVTTALTGCAASNGGYLISAASGQVIQIGIEPSTGEVTSTERFSAPWPLTDIGVVDGRPIAVGLGGVWVGDERP